MTHFSAILYKSNDFILTIYKAKPNKKVLILSSMHSSVKIEKSDTRIPKTIRFYNSTKFSVDVNDHMARKYSVKSKYQRWPLEIFSNILDLVGISAWILYKETTELGIEYQKESQLSKECSSKTIINTAIDSSGWKACQIRYCKVNKICIKCKKILIWKITSKYRFKIENEEEFKNKLGN
ncbi:piggyBac transposable element-derived protein 4-like [Vespula maculifrons]|uniref:PiggyBac transposable element-derived protein 4-like n=1 Tax=Vespula maculifrons TaxID=7453 RepID=A0ABD2AQK6_VESMC